MTHRVRRQAPTDFGRDGEAVATVLPGGLETAPTTLEHGVDVTGLAEVTLFLVPTSTTAWTVKIYVVPKGGEASDWTEVPSDEMSGTTQGDAKVFNVRGCARFAARVTAVTGTNLKRTITGA